jgi:fucose 4-O-acetylase-like acetyltransferase
MENNMQSARELSVDIAKGFGIILVVFGHTVAVWGGDHEILHKFVYSFHMPLFFGISGMYISTRSNLLSFIKSRLTRFVIPFLFWIIFYFVLYFFFRIAKILSQGFTKVNEVSPAIDLQTLKNLCFVPILANWSSIKNAGVYIDLWFLPAIFITVILYQLLYKITRNRRTIFTLLVSIFLSFIVVFLNNKYGFHSSVPWSIDVAVVCLPFLIISKYRSYVAQLHWILIPLLMLIIYYLSKDMNVEVAGLKIENYPKFFATASCGIALVFLVSVKLQPWWIGRLIACIGKRSYLIFVLQGLAFTIFRPLLSRLPLLGANEILFSSTLFITTVAFGYALYPLCTKYHYLGLFTLGLKRSGGIPSYSMSNLPNEYLRLFALGQKGSGGIPSHSMSNSPNE